jgi:cation diffusion facilitator CzcD-associated flavoprotein CzcO
MLTCKGAGPAGLVAAKTLIHEHPGRFQVTVFDKSDRIGGLWPISKHDDGLVNPEMCTNQSRHTVSFSDLGWPESAPVFPKAWQVGQYLLRYVEKYPGIDIKLGMRVVSNYLIVLGAEVEWPRRELIESLGPSDF